MQELLGAELTGQNGTVATTTALAGKYTMLYFSAHWCPPCRKFTPMFAGWYSGLREDMDRNDFEVVFVSSDKDDGQFNEYFKEMPWLALPFKDRERKAALGKKYGVQGIPACVVVDAEGKLVTKNGRDLVDSTSSTPDFKFEDWKDKTFTEIFTDDTKLTDKSGASCTYGDVKNCDAILLYFSAHWCPPCRKFTPELATRYETYKRNGKSFELIFVSWDKSAQQFSEYLSEMPWKSLQFQDARIKQLNSLFEVDGIPSLIVVDPRTGKTITTSGRGAVSSDPEGADFPWRPQPVEEVDERCVEYINEAAVLLAFPPADKLAETKAMLKPIAEPMFAQEEPPLRFLVAGKHELVSKIREFGTIPAGAPYCILSVGDGKVYDAPDGAELNADTIGAFVEGYTAGALQQRSIR